MNKILRKLLHTGLFSQQREKIDQPLSSQAPNVTPNDYSQSIARSFNRKINKFSKFSKNSRFILFSVIIAIITLTAYFAIKNLTGQPTTSKITKQRTDLLKAKASQTLNKEFLFPLKDTNGNEISKLKYTIQNAELREEIIIRGQKATTVKGRVFLIFNLKITNDYNKSIQINARDYIRLIVNNSSEKLALDIHNDPVEIQAISTKYTRLGLPINDTDTNLTLQIGEIDGKKELIKLELK